MCHNIFKKFFSVNCMISFADVIIAVSGFPYCFFIVKILTNYHNQWPTSYVRVDNIYVPAIVFIVCGILTFILRIYLCNKLWKNKNRHSVSYLVWILVMLIIGAVAVFFLIAMEDEINEKLDISLRKSLSAQRIIPDISYSMNNSLNNSLYNSADIKLACCGYNETARPELEKVTIVFCCTFVGLKKSTLSTCMSFYGRDCYHLALSETRNNIANLTKLTALWIFIMVFLTLVAVLPGMYKVYTRISKYKRQMKSNTAPIRILGPHQPSYPPTAPIRY